ncbi:penicillin acylase family protein [Dactylosporangium sp. NBC_01737]|uniref:penicillin acylase family protein n=1 Tax=Dactylosporangium sp. NBC_01737 TaxID=2975959 RepID=UPI002E0D9DAE|nr:penicillin acylase family protein [Dactylosporangium sp. NBC_01737]
MPAIADALNREVDHGSNSWVIAGRHTATGRPILASDPHLALESPSVAYPVALSGGGFDTQGDGFPGSPYVILGENRTVAWGATMNPLDVTDTFVERIQRDAGSPSGLSTVYQGRLEHVQAVDETFRVNSRAAGRSDAVDVVPPGGAIPAKTFVVPRRNNGPLLSMDMAAGTALSVQYTGFSPTRELDAFHRIDLARSVDDFRAALQFFDVGSQNFTYADVDGHIAYFTSGELPLREDLQAGAVRGNPPFQLRDGTGGNEWLPVRQQPKDQAVAFEILPFDEMPQVVDPAAGYVVTANNDPAGNTLDNDLLNQFRRGGGIFYLGVVYDGARAGRVTDLLRAATARGRITIGDVRDQQADVTLLDAQFFTPYLVAALDRARRSGTPQLAALGNDPRVVEAVGRFARWQHTTPTGIPEGYDAADRDGRLGAPSQREIEESVGATLYAVWRGQYIRGVIDAHLTFPVPVPGDRDSLKAIRQLLVDFDARRGVGRSGIDFFAVPGVADAADRRDVLLLRGVAEALDLLAGDAFAPAFGRSTDQRAYRWGKLHRATLTSPIGAPFSVPSAGNPFGTPLPGLSGIPVDGGMYTVDVANHSTRGNTADGFLFRFGPARRFVAQPSALGMRAESSLAGPISETLGEPAKVDLLRGWLTNDTYRLRLHPADLAAGTASVTTFVPGAPLVVHRRQGTPDPPGSPVRVSGLRRGRRAGPRCGAGRC